ncbi:unnamed protein product [Rotaria sp. Silwood1]|nr:unnamed protein product [Rotaria sp. Silwood1]
MLAKSHISHLSNELIYLCFDYLSFNEILLSFTNLNSHFTYLTITCWTSIQIDNDLRQSQFEHLLHNLNPTQVRSLYLSTKDDERNYIHQLLSSFSIENFENLQCLKLNDVSPQYFRLLLSKLHRLHQLSKLVILDYPGDPEDNQLIFEQIFSNRIPTLRSVTFDVILHYEPTRGLSAKDFYNIDTVTELFKLNSFSLSQLQHLVIVGEVHETFLNGQRWKQIIESYLPSEYHVGEWITIDFDHIISSFKSNFWLQKHQWFVYGNTDDEITNLYTLPYCESSSLYLTTALPINENYREQITSPIVPYIYKHLEIRVLTKRDFQTILQILRNNSYSLVLKVRVEEEKFEENSRQFIAGWLKEQTHLTSDTEVSTVNCNVLGVGKMQSWVTIEFESNHGLV